MYISRVEIDRKNRRKTRELDHLGVYHSWVEESFPQEFQNGEKSRKLWRIDTLNSKDYLLIISEDKPDIQRLEKFGVAGTGQTKDYNKLLDSLEEGQKYQFRAVINPVVSRSSGSTSKQRGRVYPLLKEEDQIAYLIQRAEKNGFKLEESDFYIKEKSTEILKKQGRKVVDLLKTTYQGQLTITDKEKFKEVLTQGLGKKKAYGFGMITVIPID